MAKVSSEVSQGSRLRPVLFDRCIHLEKGVSPEVGTFAASTKVFKVVKSREDCEELQRDLTTLGKWAT